MSNRSIWLASVGLFAGGVLLIVNSLNERRERDRATAAPLFAAFNAESSLTDHEVDAIAAVETADLGVRKALLELATADAKSAARLAAHAHVFSVSLSRVNRRDARDLFDSVLLPRIKNSQEAPVVRECFSLVERWSLIAAISQNERDDLAETLVKRLAAETDTPLRNELIAGLGLLRDHLSMSTANDQADVVVDLVLAEKNPYMARSLATALNAFAGQIDSSNVDALVNRLVERLSTIMGREQVELLLGAIRNIESRGSPTVKSKMAGFMVDRITIERDVTSMPSWVRALEPLGASVSSADADKLVSKITHRLDQESRAAAVQFLVDAMKVFAEVTTPKQAEISATSLILKMQQPDIANQVAAASYVAAVVPKLTGHTLNEVRGVLSEQLTRQSDPKSMAILGFNLGDLSEGVEGGGFDETIGRIAAQISRQSGTYDLSLLDSTLVNLVKVPPKPGTVVDGVRLLIDRIGREHQIPDLLRVAVGLEILAKLVPEEQVPPLVAQLIERMGASSSSSVLRAVAFNIGDFGEGATKEQIVVAARKLKSRIDNEQSPSALRDLAVGVLNLGERVPEQVYEGAAARASQLIKAEPDSEALVDLTAILRAFEGRGGDEPVEDAAAAIVKRIVDANVPAEVERLASAYTNIADDLEADFAIELARSTLGRIEVEDRAPMLRALGGFLALFPEGIAQAKELERVLNIPNAPCRVARLVPMGVRAASIAKQLFNPLCEQGAWEDLALTLAPVNSSKADKDDDDEDTADFHTLLVADDDGESDSAVRDAEMYPIDFNRLSDALDRYRPPTSSESKLMPAVMAGVLLAIASVGLAARATLKRNTVVPLD